MSYETKTVPIPTPTLFVICDRCKADRPVTHEGLPLPNRWNTIRVNRSGIPFDLTICPDCSERAVYMPPEAA